MSNYDAGLAGSPGGHDGFAALRDLLAIVADPGAAQARAEALKAQLEAVAKGNDKLAADRQAFEAEKSKALVEIAKDRDAAARMMTNAYDERHTVQCLREQAEAYAAKVGYWEPPSVVPVGSGLTMTNFKDEPSPRHSNDEPSPARVSDERFGQSSLTRHADDEAATPRTAAKRGR